jgi:hypothetical protein
MPSRGDERSEFRCSKCETKDEHAAAEMCTYSEEESSTDVGADTATAAKQPMIRSHVTVCNMNIRNMFKDIRYFRKSSTKISLSFN